MPYSDLVVGWNVSTKWDKWYRLLNVYKNIMTDQNNDLCPSLFIKHCLCLVTTA